ncbi:hypothetical protein CCP1ISM_760002 [Azospirillaceae bacterium]
MTQCSVSTLMTILIIDMLEVINVQRQDTERLTATDCSIVLCTEHGHEVAPIGASG